MFDNFKSEIWLALYDMVYFKINALDNQKVVSMSNFLNKVFLYKRTLVT